MANSLLDFVMSVVRDPDAAAHYAANPAQAIADANLTDVTSADVNHLIPVVAESLSSAMPSGASGGTDILGDSAHNVWASGAATAAFDAFDDQLPIQGADGIADHVPTVAGVIDQPLDGVPVISDGFDTGGAVDVGSVPAIATPGDPYVLANAPAFDDVHLVDAALPADHSIDDGHSLAIDDHQPTPHDPGFDIFT